MLRGITSRFRTVFSKPHPHSLQPEIVASAKLSRIAIELTVLGIPSVYLCFQGIKKSIEKGNQENSKALEDLPANPQKPRL